MKNLILLNKARHSQGIPLNDDVEFSVINNDNDIKYVTADVSNPNADQDERRFETIDESSDGCASGLDSSDSLVWSLDLTVTFLDTNDDSNGNSNSNDGDTASVSNRACRWLHMSFVEASDVLVALSYCSAIVSIDPTVGSGELIGSFNFGIGCAAWSNDGGVLAIVTYQLDDNDDSDDNGGDDDDDHDDDDDNNGAAHEET